MSEDWDAEISANVASHSNGIANSGGARPFQSGVSVGKGRGFGKGGMQKLANSLPSTGENKSYNSECWDNAPEKSSGDGGWNPGQSQSTNNSSSGGWNPGQSTNNSSGGGGGWNPGQSQSNDTSSGGGGGGWNPGGQSQSSSNGWEPQASSNTSSGGGGGGWNPGGGGSGGNDNSWGGSDRKWDGGGGGGRGGDGRSKGCFKCGEEGHMSRECPKAGGGGGGGGSGCRNCGEDGHFARECPNPKKAQACFKCGEEGHMSRECTNSGGGGGGGGGRSRDCRKCGEEGHIAKDCPNSGDGGGGGGGNSGECFRCKQTGHMAKDCTEEPPEGSKPAVTYVPPDPTDDETTMFSSVPTGINFDKYDNIKVDVKGNGSSNFKPVESFAACKFLGQLNTNIEKSKYFKPTPIQKHAIPIISGGRDMMACAQTGSGKTAAFLLPMLQRMMQETDQLPPRGDVTPWVVIVSPTRELAIQIHNEARKFSNGSCVQVGLLYGGTATGHQYNRLQSGCHILVATTGRLMDFIDRGRVSLAQVKYLVLDEADRMLDMGFLPDIKRIVQNPSIPPKGQRQTLMFSATFPQEIQHLASEFMNDYVFVTVGQVGAANEDVDQEIRQVPQFEKNKQLQEYLGNMGPDDRILVFVEQKRTADFLATLMSQNKYMTTSIHGDREQRQREEALRDFKSGQCPVLIATAVAARGLDIKGVTHVINYDLPKTIDEYVHRIGRTGRVGNKGIAISFYDPGNDGSLAKSLLEILANAHQTVPDWLQSEASGSGGFSSYSSSNFGGSGNANNGGDWGSGGGNVVTSEECWD